MSKNFSTKIYSAPIAGYSNSLFREVFSLSGADIIYSEMFHINEILYRNIEEIDCKKGNYKYIIQLFGKYEDNFIKGYEKIKHLCDGLDINAGCPVKKVIKAKSGSYLLTNPNKLYKMLYNLKRNIDKPLSVKLRLGLNEVNINETVNAAIQAKVDFITIHFRTQKQMFSGKANYSYFENIKSKYPNQKFILNGDIFSVDYANEIIRNYSPHGLMIARAALTNPYIFNAIKRNDQNFDKRSINNINILIKMYEKLNNSLVHPNEMRKISHKLLKSIPNAHHTKDLINKTENASIILEELNKLKDLNQHFDNI